MTTPRTRLDEATNDFERDLLRAWEDEQPSRKARDRTIGAITGGALLATTTSAGAAGGLVVKIGVTAAVLLLVAGGVVATQRTHAAPREAPPQPVVVVAPPAPSPPPPPETTAPPPPVEPVVEPILDKSVQNHRTPPQATSAPPKPPPTRALGEQVALIDKARAALDGGDAATALQTLDDYDTRFPAGLLAQEATLLRVDALLRQGRRKEAVDLANRSLAAQPKSPYAAKIRRLLDDGSIP